MKSCTALVFALLLVAASGRVHAQAFNTEQAKIWAEFKEAQELGDVRQMTTIVRKSRPECEQIYNVLEGGMAYNDSVAAWDDMKALARALDEEDTSNRFATRLKTVMGLDLDKRKRRDDLRSQYGGLYNVLNKAKAEKDRPAIENAVAQLQEVAKGLGELGEAEWQAYCLAEVANVLAENEQQLDAVKLYDDIDRLLTRAGYQGFKFQGQVTAVRDSLKGQGFDPDAKPGESTAPAGNTGTSWAKDAAGQRYSDPVPLRYQKDEKLQAKFTTPAYTGSENTMIWQDYVLRGNGPAEFEARFTPMGQKLQMSRDGVKIFMHVDGGKPQEIKAISKPNLVEMEKEYQDEAGKKQKLEYAWLACTGGSEESRFSLSLNAAPQPDIFFIRYQPACYLRGEVLGQEVMVFDDNCSGIFGDSVVMREVTTTVQPTFTYSDAMIIGKGKVAGPFTEYLEVDGEFYRMKLSPDDYTVRTRKLDVDVGTVTADFDGKEQPAVLIIEETREFKGAFFAVGKKPTTVPVGTYRFAYGVIRKGKKAAEDTCLVLPGKSVAFSVKKDENHVVELGAPFTFDWETEQANDGSVKVIGKSVVVYGRGGELYTRFFDDPVIPEKVSSRVKGGGAGGKAEAMAKASTDDYRRDSTSIWQPLDFVLDGKPGNSYEFKLELKKHNLLGGPITSDWK